MGEGTSAEEAGKLRRIEFLLLPAHCRGRLVRAHGFTPYAREGQRERSRVRDIIRPHNAPMNGYMANWSWCSCVHGSTRPSAVERSAYPGSVRWEQPRSSAVVPVTSVL